MRDGVRYLMKSLFVTFGNKVYLRQLEKLLTENLKDLDPKDEELLLYLARDISDLDSKEQKSRRRANQPKFF